MAASDTAAQTPKVSRMRRLPFDNAVVRSSKLGCEAESCGTASISATRSPSPSSATARLAPTMPPPTMAMSKVSLTRRTPDARSPPGSSPAPPVSTSGSARGHQHVILDANADVPEFLRKARRRSNVDAGLDGQGHSRLQHPPFAAHFVVADVVHIEAQPVPGAMIEELAGRPSL